MITVHPQTLIKHTLVDNEMVLVWVLTCLGVPVLTDFMDLA